MPAAKIVTNREKPVVRDLESGNVTLMVVASKCHNIRVVIATCVRARVQSNFRDPKLIKALAW